VSKTNRKRRLLDAFLEHRDILSAYLARRIIYEDDVDDILQEAFIQLQESDRNTEIQSPKSYLFIVARNILSKQLAQQSKRLVRELDDATMATLESKNAEPDQAVHEQMKFQVFKNAVDSLPPQCRRVFLLRKIKGLSHKKIASQLDISTSTVERHITLALSRLSTSMQNYGYSTSTKVVTRVNFRSR